MLRISKREIEKGEAAHQVRCSSEQALPHCRQLCLRAYAGTPVTADRKQQQPAQQPSAGAWVPLGHVSVEAASSSAGSSIPSVRQALHSTSDPERLRHTPPEAAGHAGGDGRAGPTLAVPAQPLLGLGTSDKVRRLSVSGACMHRHLFPLATYRHFGGTDALTESQACQHAVCQFHLHGDISR